MILVVQLCSLFASYSDALPSFVLTICFDIFTAIGFIILRIELVAIFQCLCRIISTFLSWKNCLISV